MGQRDPVENASHTNLVPKTRHLYCRCHRQPPHHRMGIVAGPVGAGSVQRARSHLTAMHRGPLGGSNERFWDSVTRWKMRRRQIWHPKHTFCDPGVAERHLTTEWGFWPDELGRDSFSERGQICLPCRGDLWAGPTDGLGTAGLGGKCVGRKSGAQNKPSVLQGLRAAN